MKRRLFNAGAVVSLVFSLLMVVLWARSYSHEDYFIAAAPNGLALEALAWGGGCLVQITDGNWDHGNSADGFVSWGTKSELTFLSVGPDSDPLYAPRYGGFRLFSAHRPGGSSWGVVLPLWLPTLALALPAVTVGLRRLRLLLASKRLCETCGYDLRGTPGSGSDSGSGAGSGTPTKTCPECGAASSPNRETNPS
jgi:hypothetical protein